MSLCTKSELSGGASKGSPPKIWTGKWTEGGHTYWLTHFKSRLPKKKETQQQEQLQRQLELIHKPKTVANAGLHARFHIYIYIYLYIGILVDPLRECQPKTETYINKSD